MVPRSSRQVQSGASIPLDENSTFSAVGAQALRIQWFERIRIPQHYKRNGLGVLELAS